MALTKVQAGIIEATGTPSSSTFLRGDGTWSATPASITSGTAVASTSGTSIDFTGIPSGVKRVTVMFSGVSLSGTSNYLVQIGSGSVQNTGYSSFGTTTVATQLQISSTAGFLVYGGAAANLIFGSVSLFLLSGNTWVDSVSIANSVPNSFVGNGSVALSGVLDRVRITTVNGTDTFDAGTINILWE
jgi:hypothetical protein